MLPSTKDLITPLPTGGYLVIPLRLLASLHKYRQLDSSDTEAGGILMGSWRCHTLKGVASSPTYAELTKCTYPSLLDKRSRFRFLRQSFHHMSQVQKIWINSSKQQSYFGEWHTHPEVNPSPSCDDLGQWKEKLNGKVAILIIVGQKSDWVAYWNRDRAIVLPKLTLDI